MMTTTRSLTTRTLPAVLTALLLASALSVVTAGASRAEPPQATATITRFDCDLGNPPGMGYLIEATFADKGRWVDIEWEVVADTGDRESGSARYDSRGLGFVNTGHINDVSVAAVRATATVRIVDNKGEVAADSLEVTCAR